MAYIIKKSTLQNIASVIKRKTGNPQVNGIYVKDFDWMIGNIQSAKQLECYLNNNIVMATQNVLYYSVFLEGEYKYSKTLNDASNTYSSVEVSYLIRDLSLSNGTYNITLVFGGNGYIDKTIAVVHTVGSGSAETSELFSAYTEFDDSGYARVVFSNYDDSLLSYCNISLYDDFDSLITTRYSTTEATFTNLDGSGNTYYVLANITYAGQYITLKSNYVTFVSGETYGITSKITLDNNANVTINVNDREGNVVSTGLFTIVVLDEYGNSVARLDDYGSKTANFPSLLDSDKKVRAVAEFEVRGESIRISSDYFTFHYGGQPTYSLYFAEDGTLRVNVYKYSKEVNLGLCELFLWKGQSDVLYSTTAYFENGEISKNVDTSNFSGDVCAVAKFQYGSEDIVLISEPIAYASSGGGSGERIYATYEHDNADGTSSKREINNINTFNLAFGGVAYLDEGKVYYLEADGELIGSAIVSPEDDDTDVDSVVWQVGNISVDEGDRIFGYENYTTISIYREE